MIGAMRFYAFDGLNITEIQPEERNELGFKSIFGKRPNVMQLTSETITLSGADAELILDWYENGQGRFENIVIRVVSDTLQKDYFFDFNTMTVTGGTVTGSILPRGAFDDFWSKADALTFEVVDALGNGVLTNACIRHPYLIVKDDLAIQTIVISLTIFSLTTELIRTVKAIANLGAEVANVPFGTITAVINAVVLVVYLLSLVIAIIQFIQQLVALYFPRLRYLKAISDYDLVRLSCEYLGYQLQSSLIESLSDWYTVGIPIERSQNRKSFFDFISDDFANDTLNYGYPTVYDTTPTLGSFISSIETICNAETIVYDNIVRIETRATFIQNPVATIPNVFNVQEIREMKWRPDTEEDWKRKVLKWQTDYQDKHTTDNFNGVISEYSTEPIQFQNMDMVKVLGFKQEEFLFSLSKRKKNLTKIEKLIKALFDTADNVVNAFGGNSSFASNITNRIGASMLSEEVFSITKKMILASDGRQKEYYMNILNTDAIYNSFHTDLEVSKNSGKIYETMPIPCTEYEFSKFSINKFVNLGDTGKVVELLDAKFLYGQAKAEITFKDYDNSGFNTKTIKIY
jgi:hypothetical protein